MAVYVYILDTKNIREKDKEKLVKIFNAVELEQNLLVKPDDFDKNTETIYKFRNSLEVGLGDIQNERLDIRRSPSPIFSEKFDSIIREVNDEK